MTSPTPHFDPTPEASGTDTTSGTTRTAGTTGTTRTTGTAGTTGTTGTTGARSQRGGSRLARRLAAALIGLIALGGAGTLVALFFSGPSAVAATCTDTFKNTAGNEDWGTAANWSTGVLPTSSDVVCFQSGVPEVIYNTGGTTSVLDVLQANGVELNVESGTLDVSDSSPGSSAFAAVQVGGGSLSVAGTSTAASVTVQSGTFGGAGAMSDSGAFTWEGGTLQGGGSITAAGASTFDLSWVSVQSSMNQYNVTANGTATLEAPGTYPAFQIGYNTLLTLNGTSTIAPGLTIYSGGGGAALDIGASGSLSTSGTLPTVVNPVINNSGSVTVGTGAVVEMYGGGTSSGTFALSGTGQLGIYNQSLTGATNVTTSGSSTELWVGSDTFSGTVGAGTISVPFGLSVSTSTFNAAVTATNVDVTTANLQFDAASSVSGSITLSGGTLGGTSTLSDAGTFTWTGGNLSGSTAGNLTVAGTTTIDTSWESNTSPQITQYTVTTNGSTAIEAPADYPAFDLGYNGVLDLAGHGGSITNTIAGDEVVYGGGGSAVFEISSSVTLAVSGTMPVTFSTVPLEDNGSITVPANGTLYADDGGTSSGTISLAAGATLYTNGLTMSGTTTNVGNTGAGTTLIVYNSTFDGSVNVDTVESPVFNGSSTTNFDGNVTVNTLQDNNSTLYFNGATPTFTVNTAVSLSGGTLGGSGTITDNGTFTWTGGTLSASSAAGGMTVAGATTIDLDFVSDTSQIYEYTLTTNGSANIEEPPNEAGFELGYNGELDLAGPTNTIAGGVYMYSGGGSANVTVSGVPVTISGTSPVTFNVALNNSGTVTVPASGQLLVYGGTSSGSFSLGASANMFLVNSTLSGTGTDISNSGASTVLQLGGDTIDGSISVDTIDSAGAYNTTTFTGNVTANTLNMTSSTFQMNTSTPTFTINTAMNLSGGTFGGSGEINDNGTFSWTGGNLENGSGVLVVAGQSTISLDQAVTQSQMYEFALQTVGPLAIEAPGTYPGFQLSYNSLLDVADPVTSDSNTIAGGVYIYSGGGTATLQVEKGTTLTVTGTSPVYVAAPVTDKGTIAVPAGGYFEDWGGGTSAGKFALTGAATLQLNGVAMTGTTADVTTSSTGSNLIVGSTTFAGTVTATTITTESGGPGTTTFNGSVTAGSLQVSDSTLTFNGSLPTFSVSTTIALEGGSIGGSGLIDDTGTLSWTSGNLNYGGGTITVAGATTINTSALPYLPDIYQYTLTLNGTLSVLATQPDPGFELNYQGVLNIEGTATMAGNTYIPGSGTLNVGPSGSLTVGDTTQSSTIGAGVTVSGTLSVGTGATALLDGGVTQTAGTVTVPSGSLLSADSGSSTVYQLNGGTLDGTGTIGLSVDNTAGTIEGGTPSTPGLLSLGAPYTQGTNGTMVANLASAISFSQVQAPSANIAGVLDVNGLGSYVPAAGSSFNLLSVTGGQTPTGTFGTVTFAPTAVEAEHWSTTYTTVGVTVALPIPPAVTVALTAAPNPAAYGGQVTLTATATGPSGDPTPTGTMTFYDGTTELGSGPVTMSGGVATLDISTLTVGTHALTAAYSGDGTYGTGTSNGVSEVIDPIATTTALAAVPTTAHLGDSVQLTATISTGTTVGSGPTGTVAFTVGSTQLGSAPLTSGAASITTAKLPIGADTVTATYSGDTNYGTSHGTKKVTVSTAAAKVSVLANPGAVLINDTTTLTATVSYGGSGTSPGTPTGTVTFFAGTKQIGKVVTLVAGQGSTTTSFPTQSTQKITAKYGGSTDFGKATSPSTSVFVVKPGYRLVGGDGGVFDFGAALFEGTLHGTTIPAPIVGIANTNDAHGYWMVGQDGNVYPFGTATNYGDLPSESISATDIIGIAATPDSGGYWVAGSNGKVYSFGDAHPYGQISGTPAHPIVGIAATFNGKGYWMVDSAGKVYPYGNATVDKPVAGDPALSGTIVSISPTPDGKGYWLLSSTGVVWAYGDAILKGSASGKVVKGDKAVGIAGYPDGKGYYVVTGKGYLFAFGDAINFGDVHTKPLTKPIFGISVYP